MSFVIRLKKENFKFSCSHFTIFNENKAERLHGHNYYVGVNARVGKISEKLGFAFDFNDLKPLIKELCDSLDEYILVPENSDFLTIMKSSSSIEVQFANKKYVFPKEDVKLLPVVNITSEELARYLTTQLSQKVKKLAIEALSVSVTETNGQSVSYTLRK